MNTTRRRGSATEGRLDNLVTTWRSPTSLRLRRWFEVDAPRAAGRRTHGRRSAREPLSRSASSRAACPARCRAPTENRTALQRVPES